MPWKTSLWNQMANLVYQCSNEPVTLCTCLMSACVDSWTGYEHSSFCGQQFVLERGEYPHWESWSGSNAYHIERMMSFRPICSAVSLQPTACVALNATSHLSSENSLKNPFWLSCLCEKQTNYCCLQLKIHFEIGGLGGFLEHNCWC